MWGIASLKADPLSVLSFFISLVFSSENNEKARISADIRAMKIIDSEVLNDWHVDGTSLLDLEQTDL